MGICQNPWNPKSQEALQETHIGDILREYGGGGHKFVGGVSFSSHRKAKKSMDEIKRRLQREIIA